LPPSARLIIWSMQPPFPTSSCERPAAAQQSIKVTARSSCGDGNRLFAVDVPAVGGTIADVKRLLCSAPHCVCSDTAGLVLVHKGKGDAVCNISFASNIFASRLHPARRHVARFGCTAGTLGDNSRDSCIWQPLLSSAAAHHCSSAPVACCLRCPYCFSCH